MSTVEVMEMGGTDALAADGGIVRLRPVTPGDTAALIDLHDRGSAESLRLRFFGVPGHGVVADEVERLVRPAAGDHGVVVAEQAGTLIGVASFERRPAGSPRAEFAVFVDEAHHGRGIGTLLLEHLAAAARRQGVTELTGEVLPGNSGMLRMATGLVGPVPMRLSDGVVDVRFATTVDDSGLALVDARDRVAQTASLRPLLAPRVVAVVGAGRTPGGIGHATLHSLVEFGFTGQLYAVNAAITDPDPNPDPDPDPGTDPDPDPDPGTSTILGVPAFPSLSAVPDQVDLAIIAVPAAAVTEVLTEAGAAGVRAAVVISSGFGEAGPEGGRAQAELVRIARRHGIRLVGPNCLGLVNTDPAVRLAAAFSPVLPRPGGLALASQSGAIGVAVLDHAARTGVGVSTFVSLGNKADVSGNDLLSYWYDDPTTSAVALYLESFGNPRRFARIARALGRRKPVIAVFSGRSVAGQRAGASHTAAAASPAVAVDTLCAQAGIIRTDHLGELLDAARMLTDQPLPAGDRLAILGNAGGVNVLAADAAEAAGLRVPAAGEALRHQLDRLVPGGANPLDLGAGATPERFAAALDLIAGSGEVDCVIAVVAATRANSVEAVFTALAPVVDRHADVPLAVVVLGPPESPPAMLASRPESPPAMLASRPESPPAMLASRPESPPVGASRETVNKATSVGERRAPVFDLPERAVAALGQAVRYAAWRREPLGRQPELSGVDSVVARATVRAALSLGGGWQPHTRIADILGRYGIPVVPTVTAIGERAVVAEAARMGYPVVVKAAIPELVHKTDVGAVKLRLGNTDAVRLAYREIAAAVDRPEPAVLIQPMAAGLVELVAGIVHDPLFGSLVMAGLGGVYTDLFADRSFRLVPMTDRDAGLMWRTLRAAPLLTGYRGAARVNTDAVEDLLLRLGRLAEDLPEVAELDLNPVLAGPDGVIVVDAKLRLAAVGAEPDATLRQLRPPAG